jgi:UDP-N-acetylmuramoylalanine--D-glutamate ligase
MSERETRKICVIGLDSSTKSAAKALLSDDAEVYALVPGGSRTSQKETKEKFPSGVRLISEKDLAGGFDFVVHGPGISRFHPLVRKAVETGIPVVSDVEFASRDFCCLNIAVTGTNGKTTTAELIAEILAVAQRKTVRAGASGLSVFDVAGETRDLDFVTLDLNAFQLDSIEHFRSAIAVVTNIRPDELDTYGSVAQYARSIGNIFKNQQVFDWAVVQSQALAHLRELELPIASIIITYSSQNRRADIYLDRGLIISSLPDWAGPLLNMDQANLKGRHNAENVMAALAVGRILRVKLEEMIAVIKAYRPGPHRLELVGEARGVRFINNSKATNVNAVQQSIEALEGGTGGEPNLWLIAGGVDKGLDYHDLGPLLARRVKGAFLLGEAREKLRAAWSLFTPCTLVDSLLEAVSKAAESAVAGDVVLLSPACSSLDMFQSYQHRGETFRQAVQKVLRNPGQPGATDGERLESFSE